MDQLFGVTDLTQQKVDDTEQGVVVGDDGKSTDVRVEHVESSRA